MLDYFDIDWPNVLKFDGKNVNSATSNLPDIINCVLNKYARLNNMTKYKLRLKKTLDYFWYSKINLY